MYSVLSSIVQSTTPLALRFASPLKEHGETSLMGDGVGVHSRMRGAKRGEIGDARFVFVVAFGGCCLAVEPRLRQHRSAGVREESRAELTPLAVEAMERPRGWG